jgi:hypothetical protein
LAQTVAVSKITLPIDLTKITGKSNIVDAIAFALCLPLLPAKHVHTRELVYKETAEAQIASEMNVQLNFGDLSIKRSFSDGVNEYSLFSHQKPERPMTA